MNSNKRRGLSGVYGARFNSFAPTADLSASIGINLSPGKPERGRKDSPVILRSLRLIRITADKLAPTG